MDRWLVRRIVAAALPVMGCAGFYLAEWGVDVSIAPLLLPVALIVGVGLFAWLRQSTQGTRQVAHAVSESPEQTAVMLMSGPANHLCIFCCSVEVKYWAEGPHERCLRCTHAKYQRGMARQNSSCCLFKREPGADDEIERELRWAKARLDPMPAPGPACVFTGTAPVHMPPPRPPRNPDPLSRAPLRE